MDVWALGATLYTLLAGRSPFVLPGADNSQRDLISRIAKAPLPPLSRADVPASLELALATAMAKSPALAVPSAHAFALALQRVQAELNLSVTPFEVLEDAPCRRGAMPTTAKRPGSAGSSRSTRTRGTAARGRVRLPGAHRAVAHGTGRAAAGTGAG